MVVSAFFHLLPILYLVGFGTLVGYLAGQIYAVGTMCIWIFITTGKDYIIEMFKNIKNIICGIIALALQILILLFMGVSIPHAAAIKYADKMSNETASPERSESLPSFLK